jgi:TATA-binding protein-associated factor
MNYILEEVVPAMGASENIVKRQGGIEALSCILFITHYLD